MSFILSLIAAAFYSVASAMLSRTLKNRHPGGDLPAAGSTLGAANDTTVVPPEHSVSQMHRFTLICASVAVVLHGWVVIHQTGLPYGLSLPLFTSVSATTLMIVLLLIVLCLRQPADYLGLAVYPLAAVSLIVSQASGGGTPIVGDAVQLHVFLSLIAYGILTLAAAQAVLVAVQRHFLATHKPIGFMRALPPLDTTERLLFTLLTAGFTMLSFALLSGFIYLDDMFNQRMVHKTILACTGWGIFGVLLLGRWQFGWRGKKAVHWTLAGFAVLILAYFGTKLVIEFLLN